MLQSERKLLADLKNKITQALLDAGINPIPSGMVSDLVRIERNWRRRKLQDDSGELNKAQQQEALLRTYTAIQSGKRNGNTLQIARLALHGLQKGQRSIMTQRAYRKALTSVRSAGAGRHHDHATQYLLNSLCLIHLEHLGRLPRCGWNFYDEVYVGSGLQYIAILFNAIAKKTLSTNTIGKHLVKENSRISMILKEENS